MWHERQTVKKGDAGEALVDAFLKSKNVVPYQPVFDGPHPFDRLLATADKKQLFVADVKTKARRTYYPDTGIDRRHFDEYQHIADKYKMGVFLFFVDEDEQRIYGGWLSDLSKQRYVIYNGKTLTYPLEQGNIVYFPLEAMQDICKLNATVSDGLKLLSSRSYEYANTHKDAA